ncbi:MAG: hypothetical protein LQ340_004107 [Diploschistes diacapsis]|nr:MAG: hypothetical protein LQ340_004107 [Diploschistes diacapsis]
MDTRRRGLERARMVPFLVKRSKTLGKAPQDPPPVDWIPIDTVASVVSDVVFNPPTDRGGEPCRVFIRALGASVEAVSLVQRIEELEEVDAADTERVSLLPAVKILELTKARIRRAWGTLWRMRRG